MDISLEISMDISIDISHGYTMDTYMTTLRVIRRLRGWGGDVRKADFLMCHEVVQI